MFLGLQNQCKITKNYAMASAKEPNLIDPIHQFAISKLADIKIGNIDISFTNSSQFMVITTIAIMFLFMLGLSKRSIIPNRFQMICELSYNFIANLLRANVGEQGRDYFPFVFTLFMFIFFCNLIGLIPYTFTVTSHIIVTFAFAGLIFIGVTLIGFVKNGLGYLRMFYPKGVPVYMAPIIIPIEIISYLTKPVSLSVRLMANMLAGHSIIKIFAGFVVMMGFFGIIPLAGLVAIYALEVFIAFLQAYIFTILTCIYLNDALHPHH